MRRSSRCGIARVVVMSVRLQSPARTGTAAGAFEFSLDLETPQRVSPHLLEQLAHRPQPLAPDAVVAVAAVRPHADEPRFCQRAQLQRNRSECDVRKGRVDGACRELLVPQEPKDFSTPR